jgi:hypothetical protein
LQARLGNGGFEEQYRDAGGWRVAHGQGHRDTAARRRWAPAQGTVAGKEQDTACQCEREGETTPHG